MIRFTLIGVFLLALSFSLRGQIQQDGTPRLMKKKHAFPETIPTYTLPEFDANQYRRDSTQQHHKKIRFARMFDISIDITEEAKQIPQENGRLYLLSVRSKGAYSLSLVFNKYKLPEGGELFIYNPDFSHVKGAFTARNNKSAGALAIAPVRGQEVMIEYFVPDTQVGKGSLKLSKVGHDYLDLFGYLKDKSTGVGASGDCNVNINCPEGGGFQEVKHSVARVVFNGYLCSGALVNNTKYNGEPYFLTANHCINSEYEAHEAVFYFNFESPECDSTYVSDTSTVSASTLIATAPDEKLDFSLLKISKNIPVDYKPYYAGWNIDTTGIENTSTIHHPSGDVKKITKDSEAPVTSNYGDTYDDYTHWLIKQWDVGTTEGGSSGAPLFDQNNRIIGDLTGGEASCDYNFNDYFAKISHSWDDFGSAEHQLKKWLDPNDTRFQAIDGYYPYQDKPSNLKAFDDSANVSVSWNSPADESGVNYYEVFRNDSMIASTQKLSLLDTSVIADSLFFYKVRAFIDTGGYTSFSDSIGVMISETYELPFDEHFESYDSLAQGWYDYSLKGTSSWEIKTGGYQNLPDTSSEGSANAYFYGTSGERARLVSPNLTMLNSSYVNLYFDLAMPEKDGKVDQLDLYIRYSDSLPWHLYESYQQKADSWKEQKVKIPKPSDEYYIAFEAISNGGGGVYLDDLSILTDTNAVDKPPVSVSSDIICSGDSVVFAMDTSDVYNNYFWKFGYGAQPETAYGYGPHKVSFTYEGSKQLELTLDDEYTNYYEDILQVYETPSPAISYKDSILTSNYPEGNQWYLNGEPIEGADSSAIIIEEAGIYVLKVTNNSGCSAFSDPLNIEGLGFAESSLTDMFKLYPNPAGKYIDIHFVEAMQQITYFITNLQGQIVKNGVIKDSVSKYRIQIQELPPGIYFFTAQPAGKGSVKQKFIKF
jgi:V8-like Glu-specific endopeptidase